MASSVSICFLINHHSILFILFTFPGISPLSEILSVLIRLYHKHLDLSMTTRVLLSLQNGMLRSQTYCPILPSCPVAPNLRVMDSSMSFSNLSFFSNFLTQVLAYNGALMSRVEPGSPALQAISLPTEPPGKPKSESVYCSVLSDSLQVQAPLSMGFSTQEYWSGLPFPSPGVLPDPGIKLLHS